MSRSYAKRERNLLLSRHWDKSRSLRSKPHNSTLNSVTVGQYKCVFLTLGSGSALGVWVWDAARAGSGGDEAVDGGDLGEWIQSNLNSFQRLHRLLKFTLMMGEMLIKAQTPPRSEPQVINTREMRGPESKAQPGVPKKKVLSATMWSVFFVLLSYLDREFVKSEPLNYSLESDKETSVLFYMLNDTFCAMSASLSGFSIHQVSDGVEQVRSVQDSEGNLVECSLTANSTQVKSFMHACLLGLREQKIEPVASSGLRLTNMTEVKTKCDELKAKDTKEADPNAAAAADDAADGMGKLRRFKRGFTYPGTLWCGAGNIAENYEQLGEFAETDSCCRIHDHCPHVIHAFSSSYGYTNFKWHSISHCDCDNMLKQCLRDVNDTSSRVVGQAFFNVIEVPCFELAFEERCVERHWYGGCKRYDRVPVAVIRDSIPYDFGGIEVIDVLTLAPPKKKLSEEGKDEQEKGQGSESPTQSSLSGSQEPSLTNMVTAAEDFIKVLATVSTSQSSSADGSKGETQTADKKRKKNAGEKKKDSKKRRGKGKKRRPHLNQAPKAEEGVAGAPSANKTEEVIVRNDFVEDHGIIDRVNKKEDNFMKGTFDSLANTEHSNEMMRDEQQKTHDESEVVTAAASEAKQKAEILGPQKLVEVTATIQPSTAIHIPLTPPSKPRRARLRQRTERKRQRHLTPISLPEEATLHNLRGENSPVGRSEITTLASLTVRSPISPAGEEEEAPHSLAHRGEKGSTFSTATQNTPIVGTKRQRSRQKGGRKKSRKLSPPSSSSEGEVSHALTADEDSVSGTGATVQITANPSPESQSSSERLEPQRLDKPTETPASVRVGLSGEILPKRRQQRLKGTGHRRQSILSLTDPSFETIKAMHETTMTAATSATSVPSLSAIVRAHNLVQTTDAVFSPTQTSTPSMFSGKTGVTKRRQTKGRGGKRRRKVTEMLIPHLIT